MYSKGTRPELHSVSQDLLYCWNMIQISYIGYYPITCSCGVLGNFTRCSLLCDFQMLPTQLFVPFPIAHKYYDNAGCQFLRRKYCNDELVTIDSCLDTYYYFLVLKSLLA